MLRLEFDATLDEVADVNFRLAEHTETFRRQRMWSQVFVGSCLAVAMIVTVSSQGPTLVTKVVVVGAAVALGGFFGYLYGHFHNWYVWRNCRRMSKELLGGADTVRCEFEVRPDALWYKTTHGEMGFPWSRLIQVSERQDSIELWFDPGLVVVRDRAFQSQNDRRDFVDAVTKVRRQGAA